MSGKFRNITQRDWPVKDYRPIAEIYQSIDSLLADARIDYLITSPPGLGKARTAFFVDDDENYFLMTEYLDGHSPITSIDTLHRDPEIRQSELDEILLFLNLQRSDLGWISEN